MFVMMYCNLSFLRSPNLSLAINGGRMKMFDYLNGSVDLALPLITQTTTQAHNPFLSFRVWADF